MSTRVSVPREKDFNKCFGCGRDNPAGLKLNFTWDGEQAEADFTPGDLHQGWPGIIHGGITCSLLDEAMAYVAYFHGFKGLTARTEIRLHAPLPVGEPLHVTARLVRQTRKLIETSAFITRADGSRGAEAQAVIFLTDRVEPTETAAHRKSCTPLTGSSGTPKAVLWDMDGVIVDTASYHLESWQEAFATRGIKFTAAQFRGTFGQRNDNIIRSVLGKDVPAEELKAIARHKETIFLQKIDGNVQAFPGAPELIEALNQHGFHQAVASSAPMENIRLMLGSLGLLACFQATVCGRDVTRGKPDPQVFLTAAERLNIQPRRCVVIEDAVAGVQAARAAGMKSLAVTTSHPRSSLAAADLVVDSLTEVSAETIEKLLAKT